MALIGTVLMGVFCVFYVTSGAEADANCSAYRLLAEFDEECQYQMFQSPSLALLKLEESGILTGNDVIQLIRRDCRNRKADYQACSERVAARCSTEDQITMFNLMRQSQDTYCTGNDVNFWITRYIEAGFSLQSGCLPLISNITSQCYRDNVPLDFDPHTTSLTWAAEIGEWQLGKMIMCTFDKLRVTETSPSCSSSWVDQAFYLWLFKENTQPISHLTLRQRRLFLRHKDTLFIDVMDNLTEGK